MMKIYADRAMRAAPGPLPGDRHQTGTVVNWLRGKGYGFIAPDGGAGDIFCHVRNVTGKMDLTPGERVRFEVGTNPKNGKTEAKDVTLLDG